VPNPFNRATALHFAVPSGGMVRPAAVEPADVRVQVQLDADVSVGVKSQPERLFGHRVPLVCQGGGASRP